MAASIGLLWLRIGRGSGSFESDNKPSGLIRFRVSLD